MEVLTDKEFVPFLRSLGVDTYDLSFEWMLNSPDFSGFLYWLYDNLDQNNALTAREECRYKEIEKKGITLSCEDLEAAISAVQQEYEDICLPGDQQGLEFVKLDIEMKKEQLQCLEKQEAVIKKLLQQNELSNEELTQEISKLHSVQNQFEEDEKTYSDQCLALSEEVEKIMGEVTDVVADSLNVYRNTSVNMDIAKKFFTFGPLDAYRQTQALYRSHFDLYVSKKLNTKTDSITDEDLRTALMDAKNLESRLSEAMHMYIESKAELAGEQAKLAHLRNYSDIHPSQITDHLVEAQSAVELLEQEENILQQEIDGAVQQFVLERTNLAIETTSKAALSVREEINSNLQHLLETTHTALSLDRLVYCVLRNELRTIEEVVQFASQLREYVLQEEKAQCSRIESMKEITYEQEMCAERLQSSDVLLNALCQLFGVQPSNDRLIFVKLYNDLLAKVREMKDEVLDGFKEKENEIVSYKNSYKSLEAYVFEGCTKRASCHDRGVAGLMHQLKNNIAQIEGDISNVGGMFTAVKNSDKHNLRKLWQWFLTDQQKVITVLKSNNIQLL